MCGVRTVFSVAKELSCVEFVVLGCEVGVMVAVWVLGGCWAGRFAHYLA